MFSSLIPKFNEASTWKGLIFIMTIFGVEIRPDLQESIITAGIGLAGIWSFFISDNISISKDDS